MKDLWGAGSDAPLRLLVAGGTPVALERVQAHLVREVPEAAVVTVAGTAQALLALGESAFDAVLLADEAGGVVLDALARAVRAAHPGVPLAFLSPDAEEPLLWQVAPLPVDGTARLSRSLRELAAGPRAARDSVRRLTLAHGLLDALDMPTCVVDDRGLVVAVNAAWLAFSDDNGGDRGRTGLGSDYFVACAGPSVGADGQAVAAGLRDVLTGGAGRFQYEYPCDAPDEQRWVSVRVAPLEVEGRRGAVLSHVDVSGARAVHDALVHQSLHDALTGLPNRVLLHDRLGQALGDAARTDRLVGVGLLDLDHFQRVNDSLGHTAGDALLAQVADRLRGQLRAGDTLARHAGDEFVLVWLNLSSAADAQVLSDRLAEALSEPFTLGESRMVVTASVGVSISEPGQSADDVLGAAEAAMLDAKKHGRARVRVFRDALREGPAARLAVEVGLRRALEHDELVLHYQPVIELASGRPVGVEALVRWQHPDLGLLPPGRFIPEAEHSDLIVSLGRWVLHRACTDMAGPAGRGLELAVNMSARQLIAPDLVEHVTWALADSGLDPGRLLVEITESAIVGDEAAAGQALTRLAGLGVRLAVDDFGTGYSSLLYLKRYPFSVLKLDRAFVAGLGRSPDDEAISRSVISLASAVGTTCIAEGVETSQQLAALRAYGCDLAQGFLWSPGVPLQDLDTTLDQCLRIPVPAAAPVPRPAAKPAGGRPAEAAGERIEVLHKSGASLHTIAAALNRADTRTATGTRWTATSVARYLAG